MTPRRADPFKPDPAAAFSKRQVDRAARRILEFWESPDSDTPETVGALDGEVLDELVDAFVAVTWWRGLHARPLTKVAANARYHVAKENGQVDGRIDVTQRLKRRVTMIYKLDREPTMNLTQMADIGGVRIRLPSLQQLYAVSRRLRKSWTIIKTRDYVAEPKESGYRAIHHIVKRDGRLVEVQLRTVRQDVWANQVEEDGRARGVGFKFGAGEPEVLNYYLTVAEAFAAMDRGEELPQELIERLNAAYPAAQTYLGRRTP
jgi:ppGpp synthetase/RelA/SpoT-type nucleotidyltranferase